MRAVWLGEKGTVCLLLDEGKAGEVKGGAPLLSTPSTHWPVPSPQYLPVLPAEQSVLKAQQDSPWPLLSNPGL